MHTNLTNVGLGSNKLHSCEGQKGQRYTPSTPDQEGGQLSSCNQSQSHINNHHNTALSADILSNKFHQAAPQACASVFNIVTGRNIGRNWH
jgi:hypothetical protein